MVIIMEPERRIEVSLKNLPDLCRDIINKKNVHSDSLAMGAEKYLEEKRKDLLMVAEKIRDEKTRNAAKKLINDSFEKAKDYVWRVCDGKEFDVMDRDLI